MNAVRFAAKWLVRLEIVLLTPIYGYFVFTDHVPSIAFGLIALIWLARWYNTGRLTRTTLFDLPILLLLACLPVSYAVSIYTWQSLPKVYGVVLSIAFFYATVNAMATRHDLQWATLWLVVVCAGIALAGLIGTDWAQGKIISASFIYDNLPRFIQGVPRSIAGGFARNGVGGTLALTIPFLFALLIDRRSLTADRNQRGLALIALVLSLLTLALTQSRGGILGTAAGLFALVAWRERRWLWLAVAGAAGLVAAIALGYGNRLGDFIFRMDSGGTLASRIEVWQRGWMMVQDFPFTGIGIGTFNSIAHLLYPFFIIAPDEVVAHAHNQFLEVAVDLGIPGLMAYIGLLAAFVISSWRAYRATNDVSLRALIVGLCCGLFAHHIFGLTDAFILGTKPGVMMWIFFAFVAAQPMTGDEGRNPSPPSSIGHPS
jgi:putative inorganic carbon (HCO3(-)) transporter